VLLPNAKDFYKVYTTAQVLQRKRDLPAFSSPVALPLLRLYVSSLDFGPGILLAVRVTEEICPSWSFSRG